MTTTLTAKSCQQSTVDPAPMLPFNWPSALFFGAVHGLALLALGCFSWPVLLVMVGLHWLFGSIGICLAYHRLLTHRSLRVPKWLEYGLVTIGALALQGGPIFWVAGHRQHHLYTEDAMRDPYAASKGFWWSHMLWLFYQRPETFNREIYSAFAPDLARDHYYQWLDRYFLLLQVPLALLLYGWGGWPFVIYGVFLRAVTLWHSTWLINSATHLLGQRRFATDDGSRNLWWAALLTYGEGWHNNHHAFPNVAKAGWRWWQMDVTWWAIRALEWAGLAKQVVRPPTYG
jgi:stearoyl-CoA desaturase (delta-9 desaturase)